MSEKNDERLPATREFTEAGEQAEARRALADIIEAAQHPNHASEVGPDALDQWWIADAILASEWLESDRRRAAEKVWSSQDSDRDYERLEDLVEGALSDALHDAEIPASGLLATILWDHGYRIPAYGGQSPVSLEGDK